MMTTSPLSPGLAVELSGTGPFRILRQLREGVLCMARRGFLLPLAAASAVSVVSLHVTGGVAPWAPLVAFLCVYSSYLIDHLSELETFDDAMASARSKRLGARRWVGFGGAASYALALALTAWQSGLGAVLMLLSFPVAVVFYCAPVVPWRHAGAWRALRLKDVPGLKSVYTAFFWGWLMSFALVFHHAGSLAEHAAFGGFMFLCLFVNTVLCDFKDMERDRLDGVPTLPLLLGPGRAFRLLNGVSAVAGVWILLAVLWQVLPPWCAGLLATRVHAGVLLAGGRRGSLDLGHIGEAWADFEFVLWLPLALAGQALCSF